MTNHYHFTIRMGRSKDTKYDYKHSRGVLQVGGFEKIRVYIPTPRPRQRCGTISSSTCLQNGNCRIEFFNVRMYLGTNFRAV